MTKVPFAESGTLLIVMESPVGHQKREEEEEQQEVEGEEEKTLKDNAHVRGWDD